MLAPRAPPRDFQVPGGLAPSLEPRRQEVHLEESLRGQGHLEVGREALEAVVLERDPLPVQPRTHLGAGDSPGDLPLPDQRAPAPGKQLREIRRPDRPREVQRLADPAPSLDVRIARGQGQRADVHGPTLRVHPGLQQGVIERRHSRLFQSCVAHLDPLQDHLERKPQLRQRQGLGGFRRRLGGRGPGDHPDTLELQRDDPQTGGKELDRPPIQGDATQLQGNRRIAIGKPADLQGPHEPPAHRIDGQLPRGQAGAHLKGEAQPRLGPQNGPQGEHHQEHERERPVPDPAEDSREPTQDAPEADEDSHRSGPTEM